MGGPLFAISVRSEVPSNAAVIAETYWEKYEEETRAIREKQTNLLLETLQSEISSYASKVMQYERQLETAEKAMLASESAVARDRSARWPTPRCGNLKINATLLTMR